MTLTIVLLMSIVTITLGCKSLDENNSRYDTEGSTSYPKEAGPPGPAEIMFGSITPRTINSGETVVINFSVKNTGGIDQEYTLRLYIDNGEIETKTIRVTAGYVFASGFFRKEVSVGNHSVKVTADGSSSQFTGDFEVKQR
jgi:hypothetical protein